MGASGKKNWNGKQPPEHTLNHTKFTGLESKLGLRKNILSEQSTTIYHGPTLLRQSLSLAEVFIQICYEPIPRLTFASILKNTELHTLGSAHSRNH